MAAKIEIIETEDFIRARPDGTLDLAASLEFLRDLVITLRSARDTSRVLVDTRGATAQLNVTDLYDIAKAIAEEPQLLKCKVALLTRNNDLDAQFLETASRNRGADVRGFSDFEPAITWLILKPARP